MLMYCGECREVIEGEGVMCELCEDFFIRVVVMECVSGVVLVFSLLMAL